MWKKVKDFFKRHWKHIVIAILAIISLILFFMAVDVVSFSRLACSIVAAILALFTFQKTF